MEDPEDPEDSAAGHPTMYVFCRVECWMQLTVGDTKKEKSNEVNVQKKLRGQEEKKRKCKKKKACCGESSQARYKLCSLSCSLQP